MFGGSGDPLLRVDDVCSAAKIIKEIRHGVPLRINTTGVSVSQDVAKLLEAEIENVSVFVPTADPKRYQSIMNAELAQPIAFIANCVDASLKVRIVTVETPEEKRSGGVFQLRKLAESLGAIEFDIKSYES